MNAFYDGLDAVSMAEVQKIKGHNYISYDMILAMCSDFGLPASENLSLSKKELLAMIYLYMICDADLQVHDLFDADLYTYIGAKVRTSGGKPYVYDVLHSLQKKGYISATRVAPHRYEITLQEYEILKKFRKQLKFAPEYVRNLIRRQNKSQKKSVLHLNSGLFQPIEGVCYLVSDQQQKRGRLRLNAIRYLLLMGLNYRKAHDYILDRNTLCEYLGIIDRKKNLIEEYIRELCCHIEDLPFSVDTFKRRGTIMVVVRKGMGIFDSIDTKYQTLTYLKHTFSRFFENEDITTDFSPDVNIFQMPSGKTLQYTYAADLYGMAAVLLRDVIHSLSLSFDNALDLVLSCIKKYRQFNRRTIHLFREQYGISSPLTT